MHVAVLLSRAECSRIRFLPCRKLRFAENYALVRFMILTPLQRLCLVFAQSLQSATSLACLRRFQGAEPEPFIEGDHLWQNSGKFYVIDRLLSECFLLDSLNCNWKIVSE